MLRTVDNAVWLKSCLGSCPLKVNHVQQFQLQHDRQTSGSLKRPHECQVQGRGAIHLFMLCVLAVCLFLNTPSTAHAQAKPKAAAPVAATAPESPAAPCIIAEFRHIALTNHDPQERHGVRPRAGRAAPRRCRFVRNLAPAPGSPATSPPSRPTAAPRLCRA